ncbi:SMAD FHA domain-containing [Pyrrhoderma noxium]|uniref:SMAD FHA domain-containing n=1 Tax=Pyrrhoderma noxium TaxID=2282107 RepID=A0A286UBQ9_9AGAM|nr:SMAD FHA domain-containing [Pyrrhoderma noxium]
MTRSPPPRSETKGRNDNKNEKDSSSKRYRDEEDSSTHEERNRRRGYEEDDDRDKGGESERDRDRRLDNRKRRDREYDYERDRKRVYRSRSKERGREGQEGRYNGGRDRERNRERDYRRDEDRPRYRDRGDDERRAGPSKGSGSRYDRDHRRRPSSRSRSPKSDSEKEKEEKKDDQKGKPNFNQSGLLAAATNTVKKSDGTSTLMKYNEPPEARKPTVGWRLYVFKGKEQTDLFHIHRQSCYLIGRDKAIVDIFVEHPSCSKQHAVIQYRQVTQKDDFGNSKAVIKPFIIDLESTNETHVNDEAIPTSRYYELKMGDVIKFGMSTREYVLLHDDA